MNFSTSANDDDLVEPADDLGPAHAEDGAVQEDVLATRQLVVEPRADLEQRAHAAVDLDGARRRLRDSREDLQERALARPVSADDADDLAALDLEGDVPERPDRFLLGARHVLRSPEKPPGAPEGSDGRFHQRVPERPVLPPGVPDPVLLPDAVDSDREITHAVSPGARSDDIRKGPLHPPEVEDASDEQQGGDRCARRDHRAGHVARPERRPAEPLDDPGHGIETVEPDGNAGRLQLRRPRGSRDRSPA